MILSYVLLVISGMQCFVLNLYLVFCAFLVHPLQWCNGKCARVCNIVGQSCRFIPNKICIYRYLHIQAMIQLKSSYLVLNSNHSLSPVFQCYFILWIVKLCTYVSNRYLFPLNSYVSKHLQPVIMYCDDNSFYSNLTMC